LSTPRLEAAIEARFLEYGPSARGRLVPYFSAAGVPYPPTRFLLLGLKRERELHLYAAGSQQTLTFIRSFPIRGASGEIGPKLREGDRQMPEGVYRITYLNPNSVAHLSLALDYPNPFDRMYAEEDGRDHATLGGGIMIHGGSGSVGCLAVGNEAAEDLFVLAADADWQQALIVVSPVDFRRTDLPADYRPPADWVHRLYSWLRSELRALPLPPAHLTKGGQSPMCLMYPGRAMAYRITTAILSAALLASSGACANPLPSLNELPIAGMQPVAAKRYAEASALAARGGAPIDIALEIAGKFEGATQQITQVNEGGEAPTLSRVTVLREGLLGDSLRAERWDITLARTPAGVWRIGEVKRAWRCRRGGDTERFVAVPCP
jgi:hypothetical protein